MLVIALVYDCMTYGMCLVTVVLSFVSSLLFLFFFSGDDELLTKQYDVLGYDIRFKGWDL